MLLASEELGYGCPGTPVTQTVRTAPNVTASLQRILNPCTPRKFSKQVY